jgi:hypothetical protein
MLNENIIAGPTIIPIMKFRCREQQEQHTALLMEVIHAA